MNRQQILDAAFETLLLARRHGQVDQQMGKPELNLPHLDNMIAQMNSMDDLGKMNRWLGYMQGVVFALNEEVTLDDLKVINKGVVS